MGRASLHAGRARELTSDVVWRLSAHVPFAGPPVRTVRAIASALDELSGEVLPPLVELAGAVVPDRLRTGASSFAVAPLLGAEQPLAAAVAAGKQVRADVAGSPDVRRPARVGEARATLLDAVDEVLGTLRVAHTTAQVLPAALGVETPRRWLLALQTPAEARGTGGLLGGVAVATAERGRVRVTTVESNRVFAADRRVEVPLPAGYSAQWKAWSPTSVAVNGGVSPDFPTAARIWAAQWEARRGQPVDGVATLDPLVLGYLLQATGGITLSDGTQLDGSTAAGFVLQEQYARYPDDDERDARVRELLERTLSRVLSADVPARAVLDALARGAREGRVLVAMPDLPEVQATLRGQPVGGALPAADTAFLRLTVNDAGGSKLGPYLTRSLTYASGRCSNGLQDVTVTLDLGNTAPLRGLPAYVTTRADLGGGPGSPVGQRRDYVSFHLPSGTRLAAAQLDGRPVGMEVGAESGLTVFSAYLTVDPQTTRRLTLSLRSPAGARAPVVTTQPLVLPPKVITRYTPC
nr:DUF4012 domain-containing protein [Motilibacter aurantiacus]